uniref:Uncharacterized protein n=1 Tax=Oryza rufipogon TaxID=4529 RepID=A0A0E0N3C9_ORYRU
MAPLASFGLRAADPQMPHRHIVSTRRRYMLVAVEVRIYARNAPDWLMATKSLGISVKLEEKNILENVVGLFGAVGFAQPARVKTEISLPLCLVRIHIVCTKMTEVVARIHSQGIPEGMIPIVGHTVFKASRLSIVRLYLGTARILVKLVCVVKISWLSSIPRRCIV